MGRVLTIGGAVLLIVAGGLVSALTVTVLVLGLVWDPSAQNVRDRAIGVGVMVFIALGSIFFVWVGAMLLTRVPYRILFNPDSVTLLFPFRSEEVSRNAIHSYRYLFVLGGRLGGPGDALVTRLRYQAATSAEMKGCLLFLLGEGPAPAVISAKYFVTELDRFEPNKRVGPKS